MTFFNPERTLISDTECYKQLWSIGFMRDSDEKLLVMEQSHRRELNRDRLASLLANNLIIGYNWANYDQIMCAGAVAGYSNDKLKELNDRIILGGLKHWEVQDQLGLVIPKRWKFIDLIEPQPNARASLKTLAGRMHVKKMQDLPYEPDSNLTEAEMDEVLSYMGNDLRVTRTLFHWLREPLEIRSALSQEHGIDLMSKSDSQAGEAIVKRRVEEHLGKRIYKPDSVGGTTFKYNIPDFLKFDTPDLQDVLSRLEDTRFVVQSNGKVDLPQWLAEKTVTLGDTTYAMGIGGLHSTEKNRAVHSDDEHVLLDADCASYYPAIILNSGLYPKSLGPQFLTEFGKIRDDRVAAKRAGNKVKAEGAKIQINGQFGKLGSRYSVLYAPHLMITVTLTGQLSLLMLIERSELAGIPIVSGNTDGIVFRCPRNRRDEMDAICRQWEADTGFELEYTEYDALYNASVNSYAAIKPGGKAKLKGPLGNPWREKDDTGVPVDKRGCLMKNPQATIVSNAVVDFITKGTPIEETILGGTDIRDYVTVVNVKGGGVWVPSPEYKQRWLHPWSGPSGDWHDKPILGVTPTNHIAGLGDGTYLGKVVRYVWGHDGAPIYYKTPDARTGNFKKVSKSDGAIPMMELPDEFPAHLIDYDRYIAEAREMLMDIGFDRRPDPVKPIRLFKWSAPLFWALAV